MRALTLSLYSLKSSWLPGLVQLSPSQRYTGGFLGEKMYPESEGTSRYMVLKGVFITSAKKGRDWDSGPVQI